MKQVDLLIFTQLGKHKSVAFARNYWMLAAGNRQNGSNSNAGTCPFRSWIHSSLQQLRTAVFLTRSLARGYKLRDVMTLVNANQRHLAQL